MTASATLSPPQGLPHSRSNIKLVRQRWTTCPRTQLINGLKAAPRRSNCAVVRSSIESPEERTEGLVQASRFKDLTVMVAGATGGTGAAIVEALVQAGARQVIAFVRDESKARSKLPKDVKIVQGDLYQYSTIPAAVRGCDAVVCAAGPKGILLDPLAPYKTDLVGITNLVNICTGCGVKKLVLVSSIGVDITNVFASLAFWGLLFMKKRGEEVVQRSGLDYTILRPGGLKDGKIEDGDNVVMGGPDTFGFPPGKSSGSILRSQVAECCLEALVEPAASNKVVEIVSRKDADNVPYSRLFESC